MRRRTFFALPIAMITLVFGWMAAPVPAAEPPEVSVYLNPG